MKFRIAMLLKQHMCDFCHSAFGSEYHNCVLTYYPYETLEVMAGMLNQIKSEYDGVITSGLIPHTLVLSLIKEEELSASCFGFDVENTYRIILEQSVSRENFSLSRIGIDFIPEAEDTTAVIAKNRMPELVSEFEKWLKSIPPDRLGEEEQGIAGRYLERYNRGEIDFIVTYFYSTVLKMHEHGIDCFYLYPNEREIEHTFEDIEKSIKLRLTSFPAVVRIDLRLSGEETATRRERKIIDLEQAMQTMLSDSGEGIALNRRNDALELYTDSSVLKRLTGGCSFCFFRDELMQKCDFMGTIGYGVASDFYHARLNAMDAGHYASNFQDLDMRSVLMGENEKMVHLARQEAEFSASATPGWIQDAAQSAKLSPETILRILEVIRAEGTNEISSTELIGRLGASLRTANRFLSHLQQGGMAEIVGYKSAVGKGRPIAVYRIEFLQGEE